jgi:hypothetical protein
MNLEQLILQLTTFLFDFEQPFHKINICVKYYISTEAPSKLDLFMGHSFEET